jgi:long-chain fatty acid transport protein
MLPASVRATVFVPFIAGLLAASVAGATNGYFSHGYGSKSEAVAGAAIALPQDSLTIAANPAGLTAVADGIDAGIDIFFPSRGAVITQGGVSAAFSGNDTPRFYVPAFGFSRHLSPKLAFGVALFGNGGLNTDYRSNPFARFGSQGPAGVNLQQAFLSPALAYQVTPTQSLGVALNIAYQKFEARGLGAFAGFSSAPTAVTNRGADTATGLGFRLGWSGQFGNYVTLGATWQPKTSTSKFKNYAGLFADQGGFDIPETYGVGVAIKATPALTLALDWQRILYADVPSVGNSLAALLKGVPLGATNGPGFGWRDVSAYKFGAVYRAGEQLTLRAGYGTSQQPIPASQTFFNLLAPGVVEAHLTAGASWRVSDHSEWSVSYLHALDKTVHGSGSIPAPFGGGEVDIHLKEDSLGASYNYRF